MSHTELDFIFLRLHRLLKFGSWKCVIPVVCVKVLLKTTWRWAVKAETCICLV